MNRHMTERLPRTNPANSTWPSSLSNSRTSTQKTYLSRATTEVIIESLRVLQHVLSSGSRCGQQELQSRVHVQPCSGASQAAAVSLRRSSEHDGQAAASVQTVQSLHRDAAINILHQPEVNILLLCIKILQSWKLIQIL